MVSKSQKVSKNVNSTLSSYAFSLRRYFLPTLLLLLLFMLAPNTKEIGAIGLTGFPQTDSQSNRHSCQAIQSRIDRLPATGGKVRIPSGTFTCMTPLVIDRDNVTLQGQGPSTILRSGNGANAPVIIIGQTETPPTITRSNIHVSDLLIDGNRGNQEFECWGGRCDTGGLTNVRNNGITIRRASDVVVERVTVFGAKSGGLVTEKNSRRIYVHQFTAYDNEFDGIAGYETQDSTFSGLFLHDNGAAGLSFDLNFNHNIISDAIIVENDTVGIFIQNSNENIFDSVQIRDVSQHGIFLATADGDPAKAATNNTFTGLVISNWGTDGFCVDEFVGVAICVNNTSASGNLVIAAQLIGDSQRCIKEALPGLLQSFGMICP